MIDMPSMLTYAAVSAFHAGGDQLFTHGKNFYFIDRVGHPRMYVPWDLDSVFGNVNSSIYANSQGPNLNPTDYQSSILLNPAFKPQYEQTMADLLAVPLDPVYLNFVLDYLEQQTLLPLAMQFDPNNNLGNDTVAERFDSLRNWITNRAAVIQNELAGN